MKTKMKNFRPSDSFARWVGVTVLLFAFFLPFSLRAEEENDMHSTESRTINRSFKAAPGATVEIINKYGDINVNTWEKDSVNFAIKITAEGDDRDQVAVLLKMAEVEFSANDFTIVAELMWGKNVSMVKRNAVDMLLSMKNDQRLKIDYTISLPSKCNLKIDNRFGNVTLPELSGKTYLSVFHGNVRAQSLKDVRSMHVRYGKININEIGTGDIDISFSDLSVNSASELHIKSSSSDLVIEEVLFLSLTSTNDKVNIESVKKISGSSMLSNIRIRTLKQEIDFVLKMGDLSIRKVLRDFANISISGYGTDVSMAFEESANFQFHVILDNGKAFSSPPSITQISADEKMEKRQEIVGTFGKGTAGTIRVKVNLRASYVKFETSI